MAQSGPILESKGMHIIFQKKGEKGQNNVKKGERGKVFENLGKNVQNLKNFLKRTGFACPTRIACPTRKVFLKIMQNSLKTQLARGVLQKIVEETISEKVLQKKCS